MFGTSLAGFVHINGLSQIPALDSLFHTDMFTQLVHIIEGVIKQTSNDRRCETLAGAKDNHVIVLAVNTV
jgi:hypothetical protein